MNRFWVCLLVFLALAGVSSAQTVTTSQETGPNHPIRKIIISWTSGAGGTATATIKNLNGRLLRVVTDPGSAAPTDNYDITLADEDGVDTLAGLGVDRDTVNTEQIVPGIVRTVAAVSSTEPFPICGDVTISIANAGASKTGTVALYLLQ